MGGEEIGPAKDREADPGRASPAAPGRGTDESRGDQDDGEGGGRASPEHVCIPQGGEAKAQVEHDGHLSSDGKAEASHRLSQGRRNEVGRPETRESTRPGRLSPS